MAFDKVTVWKDGAQAINIGGGWVYAVGEIVSEGTRTVRIAKGKPGAAKDGSNAPCSQVQKMNFKITEKGRAEWELVKAAVDAFFAAELA